ncbi:MAG: hypothetical protein U0694_07020 [Anaerolineae bacterium]
MTQSREEQARSQKIQDDRLNARNRPSSLSKRNASTKQAVRIAEKKKSDQKPLLVEVFGVLPRAWKGLTIGILVSLVPLIAIVILRPDWNILGLLATVLFAVIGFAIGKSTERKAVRFGK